MERLSEKARKLLEGNILPFWLGLRDEEYGGFYGGVAHSLNVERKAEKGCILNSRILWFFSEAAMLYPHRSDLRCAAAHAFRFLRERCVDWEHGGVYWSVDYQGRPLDTAKHTYNQAFAIYALSAYAHMSGDAEARRLALALFHLMEARCTDGEGYLESFKADWTPERNKKLSENGVIAERTMNTLLHVFEGYAGLYLATGEAETAAAMRRILAIYAQRIYDQRRGSLRVFCDRSYRPLLNLYSYGHDIEASWLVEWGAGLLGDAALSKQISAISSHLVETAYQGGFDGTSLATERENGKLDPWRVWWVQAEAVTGFLNEWEKHPYKTNYRDAAAGVFRYICQVLVDPRPGSEWFWRVDAQGRPDLTRPIVEPWKCPYHNGRMCFELIRRDPDVFTEFSPHVLGDASAP